MTHDVDLWAIILANCLQVHLRLLVSETILALGKIFVSKLN